MPIECTAENLVELAKCFACLPEPQREAIKVYLLALQAGVSPDPAALVEAAKCFCGVNDKELRRIQTYLLCLISGGVAPPCPPSDCAALAGDAPPTGFVTPDFIGQLYNRNSGQEFYYSTGLTTADWALISGGGGVTLNMVSTDGASFVVTTDAVTTSFSFPVLTSVDADFLLYDNSSNLSISAPNLVSVQASLYFNEPALTAINLDSLVSTIITFDVSQCPALAMLSLPSFVNFGNSFTANQCPILSSVLVPNLVPTDGTTITFSNCALDQTSVDLILHRCFLAGLTSATIDLSGGTSSAPSVAGAADAAALTLAGCSVTTN